VIKRDTLLNWPFEEKVQRYTRRDAMLYALSIGFGSDPLDPGHLRHVLEDETRVFPTMALVLAHPGPWTADPATGIDRKGVVHGEQRLIIHKDLPPEGAVRSRNRVNAVIDKGEGKGAVIQTERCLHDVESGELLVTIQGTTFCRRDGGFDKAGDDAPPPALRAEPPARPARPCDVSAEMATLPGAALLYRLNGDYNPIHSHPESARASGFERPIAHGLLTLALAARLLEEASGFRDLVEINARFAAPMVPGETLLLEMWHGDDGETWYRGLCKERRVEVLSKGYAKLAARARKQEGA